MTNLIRAEMFKLRRNKSFWVITAITTGLCALLHYLIIIDWWMMENTVFNRAGLADLNALSVFTTLLFFNLIISTLAGFYIAVEFSYSGVIKNQIISGNKRAHIFIAKYFIFSLAAMIVTVIIPVALGILMVFLFGDASILDVSHLLYLGRAYGLFTLHFLGYTALLTLLAILTEDSGKTIILSIIFTIIIFIVEKLSKPRFLEMIYENSIFYQLTKAFEPAMTKSELFQSVSIAGISMIIFVCCGIFLMNRKEIK